MKLWLSTTTEVLYIQSFILNEVITLVFNKEQNHHQLLSINMNNAEMVKLKVIFKFRIINFAIYKYLNGYLTFLSFYTYSIKIH